MRYHLVNTTPMGNRYYYSGSSDDTKPFYTGLPEEAATFWTKRGAGKIQSRIHRAHRHNFVVKPTKTRWWWFR
jgi:hypothetical protein